MFQIKYLCSLVDHYLIPRYLSSICYRTHSDDLCYESGSFVNGNAAQKSQTECPDNVDLTSRTWHKITVKSMPTSKLSSVYLDDKLITDSQANSHMCRARGGVLFHREFNDVIYFKKLQVKSGHQ